MGQRVTQIVGKQVTNKRTLVFGQDKDVKSELCRICTVG